MRWYRCLQPHLHRFLHIQEGATHDIRHKIVPVKVQYRPYLLEDLTTPQSEKPLTLYLTDVVVTLFEVTGRASFTDFINRPFPRRTETYNRDRFPSLGD